MITKHDIIMQLLCSCIYWVKFSHFILKKNVIIEMQVLLKHLIMMLLLHPAVFYCYHIC